MQHVREVAPHLLNVRYELNGGVTKAGMNVPGNCDVGCKRLIKNLESGRFSLIAPIIYTNSAYTFYKALISSTSCRNLGILSYVDSVEGMGYATEEPDLDFYRPTQGFAIYRLPFPNQNILILRAEDYVDSRESADTKASLDVDVQPGNLQNVSNKNFTRKGEFLELSSKNCASIGRVIYIDKSSSYNVNGATDVYEDNSWLSNPIMYQNQIYILNALVYYPDPLRHQPYTEYSVKMTNIANVSAPRLVFFCYR